MMIVEGFSAWVLSLLLWQVPPHRHVDVPTYPEARETLAARTERYREIADDIAAASGGSKRAAALLIAVALLESGLAKDVDSPRCAPGRIAVGGCDGGRAVSIWQIRGHHPETRREAAELALRMMRSSMRACRHLPLEERLSVYTSGNCNSMAGRAKSRERMQLAMKLEAR